MAEKIFINAGREGYSTEQVGETMTVGELCEFLENFDEDTEVYIESDYFTTFGSLTESDFMTEDGQQAY